MIFSEIREFIYFGFFCVCVLVALSTFPGEKKVDFNRFSQVKLKLHRQDRTFQGVLPGPGLFCTLKTNTRFPSLVSHGVV